MKETVSYFIVVVVIVDGAASGFSNSQMTTSSTPALLLVAAIARGRLGLPPLPGSPPPPRLLLLSLATAFKNVREKNLIQSSDKMISGRGGTQVSKAARTFAILSLFVGFLLSSVCFCFSSIARKVKEAAEMLLFLQDSGREGGYVLLKGLRVATKSTYLEEAKDIILDKYCCLPQINHFLGRVQDSLAPD